MTTLIQSTANGSPQAKRSRGRLSSDAVLGALTLLQSLLLEVAAPPTLAEARFVLDLMRQHRWTAYDATYLAVAMRLRLPLATKEADLLAAAPAAGVPLFEVVP